MTTERNTAGNSTYKKLAVQWLNEALFFLSSSLVADSFRLRHRQLLVAAKRCGEIRSAPFATSARRLTPPDVPPLRGRRTSIGFAKFPHASKLAEETSQSRRAVVRQFRATENPNRNQKNECKYLSNYPSIRIAEII